MHFSVITPALGREREAMRQLHAGPYGEHQCLWRFFPSDEGTPRDHIFRRDDRGDAPRFYVVSQRAPVQDVGPWSVQTRVYDPALDVGDELEFSLRANPVVTRKVGDRRQRHDVVMDARKQGGIGATGEGRHALIHGACSTWLHRQGERYGFALVEGGLSVEGYRQHVGKDGQLRFTTVDFQGTLMVKEPQSFKQMLMAGLGHAKAFGCGLMLVRRPI